jgi:hypothetical protein
LAFTGEVITLSIDVTLSCDETLSAIGAAATVSGPGEAARDGGPSSSTNAEAVSLVTSRGMEGTASWRC